MVGIDIELEGFAQFAQALNGFESIVADEFEIAGVAAMRSLIGPLATYPPQNPASRYRRTGTLGRTWSEASPRTQAAAGGIPTVTLGNATPYVGYVQGERPARGWQSAEAIVEAHLPRIEAQYQQAVIRLIQRLGG